MNLNRPSYGLFWNQTKQAAICLFKYIGEAKMKSILRSRFTSLLNLGDPIFRINLMTKNNSCEIHSKFQPAR